MASHADRRSRAKSTRSGTPSGRAASPIRELLCGEGGRRGQGYDLSINRYKEVVHEEINHRAPKEILADLARLETEIQQAMRDPGGC
jgi:hypothetical protein